MRPAAAAFRGYQTAYLLACQVAALWHELLWEGVHSPAQVCQQQIILPYCWGGKKNNQGGQYGIQPCRLLAAACVMTPTKGSCKSLLNFLTRICEEALLCGTASSSPAAVPPAAAPAASFPALTLLSLLLDAARPASPEPCSCNWLSPDSTESCCCSWGDRWPGGGLCRAFADSKRKQVRCHMQNNYFES